MKQLRKDENLASGDPKLEASKKRYEDAQKAYKDFVAESEPRRTKRYEAVVKGVHSFNEDQRTMYDEEVEYHNEENPKRRVPEYGELTVDQREKYLESIKKNTGDEHIEAVKTLADNIHGKAKEENKRQLCTHLGLDMSRGPLIGSSGIKTTAIDSITPSSEFNFLTNHTSNINIGKIGYDTLIKGNASVVNLSMSGILKTAIIQPPSLISQIEFFKDTTLPLYFAQYTIQNRSITTTSATGDVSLFTNITGAVQIGSIIKIKGVEIYGGAINDTIGLFPTQTGGEIQLGNGITTGAIVLGNSITSGQIKTCGNLIFKASTIASTGINNTISLFNNLTTGTMNFCNSLTSGILNMGGAGTVKVNSKFQVGSSNIHGYTSFINTDSGSPANYTITTPINIQLMVYVAGNYNNTLFLPSYISGQIIYIRNAKAPSYEVLVAAQTGQNIVFSAGGIGNNFTLATNKGAILGCDGAKWVVFAIY
jgi:hypothetical protein